MFSHFNRAFGPCFFWLLSVSNLILTGTNGTRGQSGQQKTAQVKKVQREIKVIELEGDQQVIRHNLQTELQHQLHLITADDAPAQLKTWHLKSDRAVSPVVADFMRYTLLLIAVSTLMAIGLALGLAHRFMRPLDQLVLGFRQLQQGAKS